MDLRYMNYITREVPYYISLDEISDEQNFVIEKIPENYNYIGGSHWINLLTNESVNLPNQGWKIHISSNISSAEETLNQVSDIMFSRNVSFKYVKNLYELRMKNSKYGDRSSSGKFITIYPKDIKEFLDLLNELERELDSSISAPYILNDKRWKNTNIYFRYGGFVDIPMYKNGYKVSAIQTPDGNLIEDLRLPYYSIPDFVEEPIEIQQMSKEMEISEDLITPLDNYEIEEALHFSNGGGVYLASDSKKRKVVIKEGRPGSGLDAQDRDAYTRIINEKKMLKQLAGSEYTVKLIDSFDVWEHTFIVEEYINGGSLYDWLARQYPFYAPEKDNQYVKSSVNIINQLIQAIEETHEKGIGIGDLQPSNIIIDEFEQIKLIDFETASFIEDDIHSGLMTLGFSGSMSMTREQSDWFALLRIAKQLFLPVGPISDISNNMDNIHNQWIKKTFGEEAINIINEIEQKCKLMQVRPMKELVHSNGVLEINRKLPILINKISEGIIDNLTPNSRILIPGDIRQYEMTTGKVNILTGGFGIAMSLYRTGNVDKSINSWIENQSIDELLEIENGLFTGKAGISSVLWELGYRKESKRILDSIQDYESMNDISLASGLSGIGLSFLGFYLETQDDRYLKHSTNIAELLIDKINNDVAVIVFDDDIVDKGLICGWSGVSLFLTSLYKITNEKKWLEFSEKALEKDLGLGMFDEEGAFHIDDSFRILPYICGGSAGLIIALIEYSLVTKKHDFLTEIDGFKKNSLSKVYYNCGLFRGSTGIIAVTNLIDNYKNNKNELTEESLNMLNIHLIETEKSIFTPGDSCYKLSWDLFSGSSGMLLILQEIMEGSNLTWLPILRRNNLFESSSFKKEVPLDE